jgi:PKD repeat protein
MKHILLLSVSFLLIMMGCKKENSTPTNVAPTSDFAFTGGGCTAPCAVLFENKSQNATTYLWDFGDGSTSTETNPTKTYNVGGTYTVKLTSTGNGGSASSSKQVLIQASQQSQLPSASFSYTGGGCMAPCAVTFTNTSSNASTYLWDFGDGTTSSATNPTKTYTYGGTFTVKLKAINNSGNNETTKTVNIAPAATKAKITKVTITSMPFTDGNGIGWDNIPPSGPDLFFNIEDQNNNVLFNGESARINDISQSSLPVFWNFTTPYSITNFNNFIFITAYDYDPLDANDEIGYVSFLMSNYTSGTNPYPTSITRTQNNVTVKLDLIWE